jgi:unsaturated rhamnogalacturonyl hydrolase
MKKIFVLTLVNVVLVFGSNKGFCQKKPFYSEDESPKVIGNRIISDLLSRQNLMIMERNAEKASSVHYAEACAGFGAVRLAGFLKDTVTIQKLSKRYSRVIDENIPNTKDHVDANVYGILPLELYMQNKKEVKFLNQGIDLADRQWDNPLPNGLTKQTRFWIDDMWMIGSLQIQAYRATGEKVYLERAALELDSYIQKLQQPNGLFFHGEVGHFFWGRGNGWVAAGLTELLSELPKSNAHYSSLYKGYVKMMKALLTFQAEDGMWRQLIDKPEAWKETSSTAMFGYAITIGVKKGLLPKKQFSQASQKAWLGLVKYVNNEGKLTDVCVGTGQSTDVNFYLTRPKSTGDLHGQAPVLWFAYALLLPD